MELISLENVSVNFGDRNIVKNFSCVIKESEVVAIVGKSGVGKSTLLNTIGMLEKHSSGTICLFGFENPSIDSKIGRTLLRENIGFIFQNFGLIESETVYKNFRNVSVKKPKRSEVLKALSFVGLENAIDMKVYMLSGGEQQRIAIAKLMTKNCELILADEPTGSLDDESRDMVFNLLRSLNKTMIIVTHDPVIASKCDRIIKMIN